MALPIPNLNLTGGAGGDATANARHSAVVPVDLGFTTGVGARAGAFTNNFNPGSGTLTSSAENYGAPKASPMKWIFIGIAVVAVGFLIWRKYAR